MLLTVIQLSDARTTTFPSLDAEVWTTEKFINPGWLGRDPRGLPAVILSYGLGFNSIRCLGCGAPVSAMLCSLDP